MSRPMPPTAPEGLAGPFVAPTSSSLYAPSPAPSPAVLLQSNAALQQKVSYFVYVLVLY